MELIKKIKSYYDRNVHLTKTKLPIIYGLVFLFLVVSCSKESVDPVLPDLPPPIAEDEKKIPLIDEGVKTFMTRFNVPGLSLAVTKDGKLVYAKSYGLADRETLEKVTPKSLFRIASVSKYITSVGIMKLIDDGKISMNDRVFGPGAILGTDFGTTPYPQYVTEITVAHLLHHEGGGWGNASSDPSFTEPSLNVNQLISWAIDNRPLANKPGTKTAYSNLGFQILGRIIEKVSGKSYVQFIQDNVLSPAGVKDMQMAGGTLADRKPNEVKYYGQHGQNPYGYGPGVVTRLNSCGGWIASATDLMRVMVRTDGFSTVPDLLSPSTIQIMTTPTSLSNYGCGLRVNASGNWWHGGAMSGTRTWIVRSSKGFSWSILVNTRNTTSDFTTELDRLVWPAVNNAGTDWPDIDLFNE